MSNQYMPVPWERPENYAGETWTGWLAFLGRNRDSDLLTNLNFEVAMGRLQNDAPDARTTVTGTDYPSVFVVREGHWAVGWVEWIAIHPSNKALVALAEGMAHKLDQYPVLDGDLKIEEHS